MAFSGTKLSLTIVESLMSLIGKSDEVSTVRHPDDISSALLDTDELVLHFLSLHFETTMFQLHNKPELMGMLRGRKRIAASFIRNLANAMKMKPKEEEYDNVVRTAVTDAYEKIVEDLSKVLKSQAATHQS